MFRASFEELKWNRRGKLLYLVPLCIIFYIPISIGVGLWITGKNIVEDVIDVWRG